MDQHGLSYPSQYTNVLVSLHDKKSHEDAVKIIVRYLNISMDKGIHIKPSKYKTPHFYVHATFSGL